MRNATPPSAPPVNAEQPVTRLLWNFNDVIVATALSRSTLERERSAGRFPPPDLRVGKRLLWKPVTVNAWLESQIAQQKAGRKP